MKVWRVEVIRITVREVSEVWLILKKTPTIPDYPNFPDFPNNLSEAVNLMIALINQAIYLQKKLQQSLEQKFIQKGGFRENLFRKRSVQRSKL